MKQNKDKRIKNDLQLPSVFDWGSTPHDHSHGVDFVMCFQGQRDSCLEWQKEEDEEEKPSLWEGKV